MSGENGIVAKGAPCLCCCLESGAQGGCFRALGLPSVGARNGETLYPHISPVFRPIRLLRPLKD